VHQFDEFLDSLASGDPVPGGGSVAALQAAMGAALLSMVANLTLGRKRFEAVHAEAETIRQRAVTLRDRANRLAGEDIEAYRAVAEAMALPRETEQEKASRRAQLQEALKAAAGPPLEVMRVASDSIDLASRMAEIGNPSAISDVGTAVLAARAAFLAARLNVEINVAAVRDEVWVADLRARLEAIPDPDVAERRILADVTDRIRAGGS
jgi:formiminotetrahydrofolate cyclodeaminase